MLSFLGIGGAFNVNLKNCSAFYKVNKKLILIDCGESIFEEILNKNILDDIEDLTIIITHFHSDHVGSLGSLIFYSDKINIRYELPKLELDLVYFNNYLSYPAKIFLKNYIKKI